MPDLVGSHSANSHLGFGGMHPLPRPAPLVDPDQSTPGGRRRKDLAKPLGKSGQDSSGHMPIFIGRDHVVDRLDLAQRQLLRRTSRTRRAVVEATGRLVTPGVVPGLRQAHHAEHGTQREVRSRSVNGLQQSCFGGAVRQPGLGQGEARDLEQQRHQPQQGHEAVNAMAQRKDFLPQANRVLVGYIQRHDRL
jgi:hypothetical protein